MRHVRPLAPLGAITILAAIAAATSGCETAPVELVDDVALSRPASASEISVPTVPAYLGAPNVLRLNDAAPTAFARFEVLPGAEVAILLSADEAGAAGPLGFTLYRVEADGRLRERGAVTGAGGVAHATLRSVAGGLYVVEAAAHPHPASVQLHLACTSDRCVAALQPGESCRVGAGPGCDDGLACIRPEGTCELADASGVCSIPPTDCPQRYWPVCGCDGLTYGNRCVAVAAGVSIAHLGVCAVDGDAGAP